MGTTESQIDNSSNIISKSYVIDERPSYHITKDFGGKDVMYWPMSGFGQYCSDIEEAKNELNKLTTDNPSSKFKLVKYQAISHNGKIVGITGQSELMEEK